MRCYVCLDNEVSEDPTEDHYFVGEREVCSLNCFMAGIGGHVAIFHVSPVRPPNATVN